MQRLRNDFEKGNMRRSDAQRPGERRPNAQRPAAANNARNAQQSSPKNGNSANTRRANVNRSASVSAHPETRRSAARPETQRSAAVRPNGTRPNAQRTVTARPAARPRPAPKPEKERVPKKAPVERIKPKKKKKEKDPNRIRFLSVEGKVDIPMLIITLVLLAIGVTMMFSASIAYSYRDNDGDSYAYVRKQLTAAVIGLAGMTLLTLFDYRFLRFESKKRHITAAHLFLIFTIGLNLLCPIIGIEAEGGQKRWLQLPVFGQFQPSDFLKVAVIVFLAYYIHKNSDKMRTFYSGIVKPLLIMIPVAAVVVMQTHLSCLVIIFMIFAIMLFVGGVNLKEAIPIALVGVLGVFLLVSVVKVGYFQERIEYMDPLSDPGDKSFQNYQSALAIGSGGIWGKGFGNSSQKYGYLPFAQNDFVYAVLVEEFGLVGGVFVIVLFIVFIMRGLYIARRSEDKFGCLMATGITVQIGMQALLNIAVNLCCIPNTGISLPFFSYGGTALVLQLWEMGLLLSISKRAKVN